MQTKNLRIHGYMEEAALGKPGGLRADAEAIQEAGARTSAGCAAASGVAVYCGGGGVGGAGGDGADGGRCAGAAIRGRCFLNARAAMEMAEPVARLLAELGRELGRDEAWVDAQVKEFCALAEQYRVV
jgi:glycerol-3-phosphate dehydrogenase